MKLNYMALAVPFFLFFIIIEYIVSVKKKKEVHHFSESIANLNVGVAERISDLLTTGSFFFLFTWINQHIAIFHISPSWYTWIILFLLTDLVWYWYHRFGHVVNLFWSVHVVHHQSDDFNFTVSARITVLQAVIRGLFWSVLPLIGFPAQMITILLLIHGAYPFFTHTQLIGKLGWIEKIFVTPSHHRVHHSSNPEYLDKNFGDVLIIWDKMFGTFAEETVKPVYGLTKSLNSHSFLWQHFHFILEMGVAFKKAKGIKNKLKVIFGKPDDIDPRIRGYLESRLLKKNNDITPNAVVKNVIKGETILTLFILFFTILFSHYLSVYNLINITLFLLVSVITTGAMLEQKRWIFHLEFARLALICVFICSLFPNAYTISASVSILMMVLLFYEYLGNQYCHFLYNYSSKQIA